MTAIDPELNLYTSVLLLGAAHGVFLALALVNTRRGNVVAHRLLALLTLTFAADLGVDFLLRSRYLLIMPKLVYIEIVTSFIYGPLTYLYVKALTSRSRFQFTHATWAHFIPFVVGILLLIPFMLQDNSLVVAQIYEDADIDHMGLWILAALLVIFAPIPQIGIYLVLSVRQLVRHSRIIRNQFSSIERINLAWLRNLLLALLTLYIVYALIALVSPFADGGVYEEALSLMMVVVIYAMGYMGMRQPRIFSYSPATSEDATEPEVAVTELPQAAPKKYRKSALDADMSQALHAELKRHMDQERPFLESNLTLTDLAGQLGISPNYLSQVINEQSGCNFFDFVNAYRVETAKSLLVSARQTSILDIAMDAGFNSKSAFYTAFKQHTSMTPSQFRKAASHA